MQRERFVGIDLGKSMDFSAWVGVTYDEEYEKANQKAKKANQKARKAWEWFDKYCEHPHHRDDEVDIRHAEMMVVEEVGERPEPHYEVVITDRAPLKTPYTKIAAATRTLVDRFPDDHTELIVDATGVGGSVVELFDQQELAYRKVTVTGGEKITRDEEDRNHFKIPRLNLLYRPKVWLEQGLLKIAPKLEFAEILVSELVNLRHSATVAGREIVQHREGEHDDLTLALGLACWAAERGIQDVDSSLAFSWEPPPKRDTFERPDHNNLQPPGITGYENPWMPAAHPAFRSKGADVIPVKRGEHRR